MKNVKFYSKAFDDYNYWIESNKNIYKKINQLIKDIDRDPFNGIGKPEPLKRELSGFWSRRITEEHRLVYKITNEEIIIISCKYHY